MAYYGTSSGHVHASAVRTLMAEFDTRDVLDYGCGKRTLQTALGIAINNFDPCIIKFSELPKPADIVACIEVLEHIEPEYIDSVIADLRSLTKQALFATICTAPSTKFLGDGRNSHLIVEPENWWLDKISGVGFAVRNMSRHPTGFYVTAV